MTVSRFIIKTTRVNKIIGVTMIIKVVVMLGLFGYSDYLGCPSFYDY
jgi:hypothetical protein